MHYVLGDIHNELDKLKNVLSQIKLTEDDTLYVLGDLFDRGGGSADPVGVYFALCGLRDNCCLVLGNHDRWLATYIIHYFETSEKKRGRLRPYEYNSFELMKRRLTRIDMLNLANFILKQPLQVELKLDEKKYLFAHARASHPLKPQKSPDYYLLGELDLGQFFLDGIHGYISICGHTSTGTVIWDKGRYLGEKQKSVWVNEKENVYLMDCGSGCGGRLACMCLETGECFYG